MGLRCPSAFLPVTYRGEPYPRRRLLPNAGVLLRRVRSDGHWFRFFGTCFNHSLIIHNLGSRWPENLSVYISMRTLATRNLPIVWVANSKDVLEHALLVKSFSTRRKLNTAATGLFCRGRKIESRLLKFCQSHVTPLSGMAKCDSAKFKQPAITFCLLIKIVRPRQ